MVKYKSITLASLDYSFTDLLVKCLTASTH